MRELAQQAVDLVEGEARAPPRQSSMWQRISQWREGIDTGSSRCSRICWRTRSSSAAREARLGYTSGRERPKRAASTSSATTVSVSRRATRTDLRSVRASRLLDARHGHRLGARQADRRAARRANLGGSPRGSAREAPSASRLKAPQSARSRLAARGESHTATRAALFRQLCVAAAADLAGPLQQLGSPPARRAETPEYSRYSGAPAP